MTHKTKGIVLRTTKYGETSLIVSIYTELFGIQSYLVKGVRQQSKRSSGKGIFFQPAAMLDMVVYHNEFKNLNFIREYQWDYLYTDVLSDVIKNTVATFVVEVLTHSLKQPEANPALFYLASDTFKQLDNGNSTLTANLPLYFILHLGSELGFRIQGNYCRDTPICDLYGGTFIAARPEHNYYLETTAAETTSRFLNMHFYNELEDFHLSKNLRRDLLLAYQQYMALHVNDFGEIRSLPILHEILR